MKVEMSNQAGSLNFALIGAGGYIAPRHMKAIQDTGNDLVAALDPSDSVGILDSYSHEVAFFTEFERFDRHAEKLRSQGSKNMIHYVSIASPNYLHDAHIRFSLRIGADAICEKPLVLNPWNVDALSEIEAETGRTIYNVLQLRNHPAVLSLKEEVSKSKTRKKHELLLSYISARGRWYFSSWKGNIDKSGGIATNIGIHFFDVLIWIFGSVQRCKVHISSRKTMAGLLELEKANVRWFLSIDENNLPNETRKRNKTVYRSLNMDGKDYEFSEGFTDLHTLTYHNIMKGLGYGLIDARPAIELVYQLRNATPETSEGDHLHPFISNI